MTVDLLVVGAGPAGAAAAIQAAGDGLSVVLIGDEAVGGLVRAAWRLDNLPGFPAGITGTEFADLLAAHLRHLEITLLTDRVVHCVESDDAFQSQTDGGRKIHSRALVLATGTRARSLPVPGLATLESLGRLHHDVRTLPPRLVGLEVAVVGAGEVAADTALSILQRGGRARIFARNLVPHLRPGLAAEVAAAGIPLHFGWMLAEVQPEPLMLTWDIPGGGRESTAPDQLMVCVGREPRAELRRQLFPAAPPPATVQTDLAGLYLAGDLIRGRDRFVATALGDGQRAARAAFAYLRGQ